MFTPQPHVMINVSPSNLSSGEVPASCVSTITPTCILDLYTIPTTKATEPSNRLAVTGFDDQFANEADIQVCLLLKVSHIF